MTQGNFIGDLAKCVSKATKKLSDAMPAGMHEAQKDLEKTFHAGLESTFSKLDLVTRKEFDTQAGVLAKTRKKLEALEKQVAEFERQRAGTKTTKKVK